jgi:N-hydroxyarylamine O-acetyltransferase
MAFEPDLVRYFDRIGYRGPRAPSLATLNALILAHVSAIPFENLDVLLGRPIVLDPAAVEQKLIVARRGGYCFEQNTFFMSVLRALGFDVTAIGARVRFSRPRDETPPRTHVFLRVELADGSWLVDVGVGGLSPTAALRLELDSIQQTPHEARRLCSEGDWRGLALRGPTAKLYHQALIYDVWHDVCDFTLEPMHEIDRELANWFTSAHPDSHFKNRLMAARATPTGRTTLLNRRLTRRSNDGSAEHHDLQTPAELLDTLAQDFGLVLPPGTRFDCPALEW